MTLITLSPLRQLGAATTLALAIGLPALAQAAEPAPALELPTQEGTVSLEDLKGKVVLLDFWASWCGPCRQSFPWMNDMQAKYGDQGFEVVAVNLDQDENAAATFLDQIPANFTVAYDAEGKTPEAYEVMGMPSAYLIDRNGNIHSQHIGFHNDRKESYEEDIRSLLSAAQN